MGRIVGIDVGAKSALVSALSQRGLETIRNPYGELITPSTVAYDGDIFVGRRATGQALTNSSNTISVLHRIIGRKFSDPVVQKLVLMVPYSIVEAENGDAWIKVKGERLAPPQVVAELFSRMKIIAEMSLGEVVTDAVVVVPTKFDANQRRAIENAGEIAGLNVKRMINESTAVAVAYSGMKPRRDLTAAIYNFGAGSFDVSIVKMTEVNGRYQHEVLSSDGDAALGGVDFDFAIVEYLLGEMTTTRRAQLKEDTQGMWRLKEAVERAKIKLSTRTETEIYVPFLGTSSESTPKLELTFTRARLESLVEKFVTHTIELCRSVVRESGLDIAEIDDLVLAGGQSRMPLIEEKVQELFGKAPREDVGVEYAAVIGSAIQAAVLAVEVGDLVVADRTVLSFGYEDANGVTDVVIAKNAMIPASKTQSFMTGGSDKAEVSMKVVQGELSLTSGTTALGRLEFLSSPSSIRGRSKTEVVFDVDSSGMLDLRIKGESAGFSKLVQFHSNTGLSSEELEAMRQVALANAARDFEFQNLYRLRTQGGGMSRSIEKIFQAKRDAAPMKPQTIDNAPVPGVPEPEKDDSQTPPGIHLEVLSTALSNLAQRTETTELSSNEADDSDAGLFEWSQPSEIVKLVDIGFELKDFTGLPSVVDQELLARISMLERTVQDLSERVDDEGHWPDKYAELQRRVASAQERPVHDFEGGWSVGNSDSLHDLLRSRGFRVSRQTAAELWMGLQVKKIIILQGVPGTGKSTLAKLLPECLLGTENHFRTERMHPDVTVEDAVGGLTMSEDQIIGPSLGFVTDAVLRCHEMEPGFWLVVDEFNRGRVDEVFSPLLDALVNPPGELVHPHMFPDREDERARISIPQSFRIIGTMNPLDAGIYEMSQALTQRIRFVYLPPLGAEDEFSLLSEAVIDPWEAVVDSIQKEKNRPTLVSAANRLMEIAEALRQLAGDGASTQFAPCEIGSRLLVDALRNIQLSMDDRAGIDALGAELDRSISDCFIPQLQACGTGAIEHVMFEILTPDGYPVSHARLKNIHGAIKIF